MVKALRHPRKNVELLLKTMTLLLNQLPEDYSAEILIHYVNARVVICKSEQLLNLAYFDLITLLNPHTGGSFSGFGKIFVYQ